MNPTAPSGRESTVVVVVSNSPASPLKACLESVIPQADEVLVVDNGSSDGSASRIAREVGAQPLRLPRNIGFAGGANAGIARARGEIVALLNDDAIAGPDWLAAAGALLRDPTLAAVGPNKRSPGATTRSSSTTSRGTHPEIRPRSGDHLGDARGSRCPGPARRCRDPPPRDRPGLLTVALDGGPEALLCPGYGEPSRPGGVLNGEQIVRGRVVELVNSAGSYLRADGYAGDIGDGQADDGRFDATAERFSLSGVALVTTRAALDKVGPFERVTSRTTRTPIGAGAPG